MVVEVRAKRASKPPPETAQKYFSKMSISRSNKGF